MSSAQVAVAKEQTGRSHFDAIVFGAGISGLVSASILLRQGCSRILVVDEYATVGGNHIDCSVGGYTFDVGSFIFQDDSPLLNHFPELLPLYVPIDPGWSKLNPQGLVTTYPFSIRDDLLRAGAPEVAGIMLSAAWARLRHRRLENAQDFVRYWVGARLARRSGLESYMERFCGLPADKIDLAFAEQRMMWIAEYASVRTLLRRWWSSRGRPAGLQRTNQQLARPRDGFASLYAPVVYGLEERGASFCLGARLGELRKVGSAYQLRADDQLFTSDRVVSTIPIDRMRTLCGLPDAAPLPEVTLVTLFFSFSGDRGFVSPILYNFDHGGRWKRLTMYSDFYGRAGGREYFAVEVIADALNTVPEVAASAFRSHTAESGLLNGDLRLEGSHTLNSAYPVYTGGAGVRASKSILALRDFGVESFGRQGGFQYQPTARVSTVEAEAALRPA